MQAMPRGSVCSLLPHMMEKTFHLAQLAGARLNAIDDLPKDEMRNSGVWKSTITGGLCHAEHKNRPPFDFFPFAGHLMGCNALPATSDTTRGFRRRVVVLQFTNVIADGDQNRNLAAELLAETSALVSYCLQQLSRAIERNSLTIPQSSEALVDAWLKASAPIETFFEDCLRPLSADERANPKLWTGALAVYERYVEWAKETGHTGIYSLTSFGEWLKPKLGIQAAEWGKAPYKRDDGRFYPVAFSDSATSESAEREAARPNVVTAEQEAEIHSMLEEHAKLQSSYVN
jgi:P4 family phage/plasmid primase-like protien